MNDSIGVNKSNRGDADMIYSEGDFVVVINIRASTELPDETYAVVESTDATGGYPFGYRIRIIGGEEDGRRWWIHPNDLVSAEFYCGLCAQKQIRDSLTDWYLDKLLAAKTKKAKAEIQKVLEALHPKPKEPKRHANASSYRRRRVGIPPTADRPNEHRTAKG